MIPTTDGLMCRTLPKETDLSYQNFYQCLFLGRKTKSHTTGSKMYALFFEHKKKTQTLMRKNDKLTRNSV